jgi:hypothetical protein
MTALALVGAVAAMLAGVAVIAAVYALAEGSR